MKAITIKNPYSYLICKGIKDIENRTWKTKYRGKVLIHCAASPIKIKQQQDGQATIMEIKLLTALNESEELGLNSCIIGEVDIVDCITDSKSEWALPNNYHWVLENAILYDEPIRNIKGKLSFWDFKLD